MVKHDRRKQGRIKKTYGAYKFKTTMRVTDELKDRIDYLRPSRQMALADKVDSLLNELVKLRHESMPIDAEFRGLLDNQKHPLESDLDCVRRIIRNISETNHNNAKKVEALEQELQNYKQQGQINRYVE